MTDHWTAAYQKGLFLYHQSRWKAAAEQFRAAVEQSPTSPAARAMLALAMLNAGDVQGAHSQAAEAIRLQPDYAFGHYAMAHVFTRLRPNDPWYRVRLGIDIAKDRLREALKLAKAASEESVRLEPLNPDFLAYLSELEGCLGRWDASLAAADRALAADPSHLPSAKRRAESLRQLGRTAEARAEVTAPSPLEPDDPTAHRGRGLILLQAGDWQAARDHFAESLRLNPNDKHAQIGLRNANLSRFAVTRWLTRLALWCGLAANRPALIAACVTTGLMTGVLRDYWHVETFVALVPAMLLGAAVAAVITAARAAWKALRRRTRSTPVPTNLHP